MTSPPLTIDDLQQLTEPEEVLRSTSLYLDRLTECRATANAMRRKAYRELADQHGVAEAARRAEVSITTIKNALVRSD